MARRKSFRPSKHTHVRKRKYAYTDGYNYYDITQQAYTNNIILLLLRFFLILFRAVLSRSVSVVQTAGRRALCAGDSSSCAHSHTSSHVYTQRKLYHNYACAGACVCMWGGEGVGHRVDHRGRGSRSPDNLGDLKSLCIL